MRDVWQNVRSLNLDHGNPGVGVSATVGVSTSYDIAATIGRVPKRMALFCTTDINWCFTLSAGAQTITVLSGVCYNRNTKGLFALHAIGNTHINLFGIDGSCEVNLVALAE